MDKYACEPDHWRALSSTPPQDPELTRVSGGGCISVGNGGNGENSMRRGGRVGIGGKGVEWFGILTLRGPLHLDLVSQTSRTEKFLLLHFRRVGARRGVGLRPLYCQGSVCSAAVNFYEQGGRG